MKSNNIFYFATKELTTDAFLSWIMCYLDSSDKYKKEKQIFFDDFILKEEDKGRQINNVNIKRQENDVDILLEFSFLDDNSNEQVLFEDKTWTSYHGDQLQKYKQLYPDCYRYIYFKLAYVNSEEEKYVKDKGYEIYTSFNITNTLEKIKYIHDLVKMYLQYVNDEFNSKTTSFENELFVKNNYNILWNAEAQKFLCDKIASELTKSEVDYLEIRNGSSFGRPWTQIDIAETTLNTGYWEKMFWRVDIRSGKFYIRLNLYSDPSENEIEFKKKRLRQLREKSQKIIKENGRLVDGKTTNGRMES